VRSSRKAWNLVVEPRYADSPSLQLLLISWAVMACFLHRKVAGQMLPMGPQIFPITFPLATLYFYEWRFNLIIKRRILMEIFGIYGV